MTGHPPIALEDQKMILHANARGQVRIRTVADYATIATLIRWDNRRARIEYRSGARCTIRHDQILEVMPLSVVEEATG